MRAGGIDTWNREELIARLDSGQLFPSLSPLTVRLMELSSDEDCSMRDIAALIEQDASLTLRILKLANSTFFRSRHQTLSVQNAIVRIGISQTRLLALSLSLKDTFPLKKVGAADYRRYWRLSLYQGLIARFLAKQEDPEEAFAAALTLDIGLLVFLHTYLEHDDDVSEIPWYPLSSLLEWESKRYGVNHREIGEVLLTHWKFPSRMILCQRSHQFGYTAAALPPLTRICSIASHLSAFICQSEVCLQDILATMEHIFGLAPAFVADIVTLALMKVDSISEMFDVQVDSEEDKVRVMRKVRDALALLSQRLAEEQARAMSTLAGAEELPRDSGVRAVLQMARDEIQNPLAAAGSFARRLAKTIEVPSNQERYIKILLSETMKLEETLNGIGQVSWQSMS